MKKNILAIMIIILSTIPIFGFYKNANNNLKTSDIYVYDNESIDIYYIEKYDILNNDNTNIQIKESFQFNTGSISYLSYENCYLDIDLLINKNDNIMELEYNLVKNNYSKNDYITINICFLDNEYYAISRYGYVNLNELDTFDAIKKCSSGTLVLEKLFSRDFCTLDGGGITTGCALGGIVAIGTYSILSTINEHKSTSSNYTYIQEPTPNTSTNQNSNFKKNKIEDRMLKAAINDFLHNESNSYGWTGDELNDAFKVACKENIAGELQQVTNFYLRSRPLIVLGIYLEDSDESYDKQATNHQNSIIFSTNNWDNLLQKHSIDGMWLLNKFFLSFWISRDCYFLLTRNPSYYFDKYLDTLILHDHGNTYSKELQYIYHNNYDWVCYLDENLDISCDIYADVSDTII